MFQVTQVTCRSFHSKKWLPINETTREVWLSDRQVPDRCCWPIAVQFAWIIPGDTEKFPQYTVTGMHKLLSNQRCHSHRMCACRKLLFFVARGFISMISKVKMQEKIQKDWNSKTLTFALTFAYGHQRGHRRRGYSNSYSAFKCRHAKKFRQVNSTKWINLQRYHHQLLLRWPELWPEAAFPGYGRCRNAVPWRGAAGFCWPSLSELPCRCTSGAPGLSHGHAAEDIRSNVQLKIIIILYLMYWWKLLSDA